MRELVDVLAILQLALAVTLFSSPEIFLDFLVFIHLSIQ